MRQFSGCQSATSGCCRTSPLCGGEALVWLVWGGHMLEATPSGAAKPISVYPHTPPTRPNALQPSPHRHIRVGPCFRVLRPPSLRVLATAAARLPAKTRQHRSFVLVPARPSALRPSPPVTSQPSTHGSNCCHWLAVARVQTDTPAQLEHCKQLNGQAGPQIPLVPAAVGLEGSLLPSAHAFVSPDASSRPQCFSSTILKKPSPCTRPILGRT